MSKHPLKMVSALRHLRQNVAPLARDLNYPEIVKAVRNLLFFLARLLFFYDIAWSTDTYSLTHSPQVFAQLFFTLRLKHKSFSSFRVHLSSSQISKHSLKKVLILRPIPHQTPLGNGIRICSESVLYLGETCPPFFARQPKLSLFCTQM